MRLGRFGIWVLASSLAAGCGAECAGAQATTPPTDLSSEFASLASRAATIFVGQVISIDRRGGAVEITFNVEQAIAGSGGAQYTLREWAGLWPQGQFRYTVGQRSLVFLNGTSAAGFGSPVDGTEGVVPVIVQGANAPELLDIRRLSAAILRTPGMPLAGEANGAIQLAAALPLIAAGLDNGAGGLPRPEPVRLPMPVRVGIAGGGGIQGTTGSRGTSPVVLPVSSPETMGRVGTALGVIDGSR